MSAKKIQAAINKVFENISQLSAEEVNNLVNRTPDKWGKLLLEGGFFDPASTYFSDDELLNKFPELIAAEASFSNGFKLDFVQYYNMLPAFDSKNSWHGLELECHRDESCRTYHGEYSEDKMKIEIEDCEWVKAA